MHARIVCSNPFVVRSNQQDVWMEVPCWRFITVFLLVIFVATAVCCMAHASQTLALDCSSLNQRQWQNTRFFRRFGLFLYFLQTVSHTCGSPPFLYFGWSSPKGGLLPLFLLSHSNSPPWLSFFHSRFFSLNLCSLSLLLLEEDRALPFIFISSSNFLHLTFLQPPNISI